MNKPTFFLSSTIYDFKDLRSSLKYYLEEQGCTVLASEFNDFLKPLDTNSYDACLNAIRHSDYFILLIGSRVGGWFDKENRISITQQEYREAYKLHQQGTLKLLIFVRAEVWSLREDRSALKQFLEKLKCDTEMIRIISNHPSKHASDADFIIKFIEEVGRNSEIQLALSTGAQLPTGNWIHVIENFKDVIDVIHTQVFAGLPIEDVTLLRLLQRELTEYLRASLVKTRKHGIHSPREAVELFHDNHNITIDIKNDETITIKTKYWDYVNSLSFNLLAVRFHPLILPQVLRSTVFLQYDSKECAYRESPVYEALYQLQEEIRKLSSANNAETLGVVFQYSRKNRGYSPETLDIESIKLFALLHLLDRWVNIVELSRAVLKHLGGELFRFPKLRPRSPIRGMDEEFDEETPTIDDIEKFINSTS